MDDCIDNYIKSRKGEKEVLRIVKDLRATKAVTGNTNVLRAIIMQKLILPRLNKIDDSRLG